jgi:hypothetical protein
MQKVIFADLEEPTYDIIHDFDDFGFMHSSLFLEISLIAVFSPIQQ